MTSSHYMHTKQVLRQLRNANEKHASTVLVLSADSVLSQSCQALTDSFRAGDCEVSAWDAMKMKWSQWVCRCTVALFLYWFSNGICTYSMLQQSAVVFYCHWSNQSRGNFIACVRACFCKCMELKPCVQTLMTMSCPVNVYTRTLLRSYLIHQQAFIFAD